MALPVVLFLHAFVISCLSLLLPLISACLWLSLSPPSSVFLLSSLAFHCSLKYFFPLHTLLLSLTLAESPPPLSFSLLHHFSSAFDLYLSFPLLSFSFFSLFLDKKQQVKVKDVNSNTTRYAKKTLSTLRFFYFYLKHFGVFLFFFIYFFFLQRLLLSKCSLMYLCCYSFTSFLLMLYSHAAGIYLSTAIKTFYTDFCGTINFVQMSYFHCFMQAEKYVCLCVCVFF